MMDDDIVEGFSCMPKESKNEEEEDEEAEVRNMVKKQNRKNKKSGGFQSMGLSRPVYRAIMFKGYKVPTPIQRKSIPVIMENIDVVAMARTGSGKTAAFLIPLLEKLKAHSAKSGARALILSPTRELAIQTLKFTKELGKFCGLRSVVILGGDSMEDQFESLHKNPDIIIATPGRLLHVLVEMELKLKTIEYVVFDEADRLFEMGFQIQLQEIISRLPDEKQTVMFSATLPKLLIEFAKAGLNNPTLIRLDVESKLSSNLKLSFLTCRADDKVAVLINLLNNVFGGKEQSVVFLATKHHVEYLKEVLAKAGISCTYIYSSLDQAARKINVAKFQSKKCLVLLVTDVAARGIDIPLLDNVINFNFPAKSKLFIHRVGRVARAGRKGHAYSIISPDEFPYVIDLHLFLGKPVILASAQHSSESDSIVGSIPQQLIDEESEVIQNWHAQSADLTEMKKVCDNAYKMYLKSRPLASSESTKRAKEMLNNHIVAEHPLYKGLSSNHELEHERKKFIDQVKSYKSKATIFEVSSSGKLSRKVKKSPAFNIMKVKRNLHGNVIEMARSKISNSVCDFDDAANNKELNDIEMSSQNDIENAFPTKAKKKKHENVKNNEFYIPYKASDHHTEEGLEINSKQSKFEQEAKSAVLDLTGDDERAMKSKNSQMKWDRKRKRFVNEAGIDTKRKKIKTESGTWISSTYKSDRYKQWKHKQKVDAEADDNEDSDSERKPVPSSKFRGKKKKYQQNKAPTKQNSGRFDSKKKPPRKELKTNEEILKARKQKEKLKSISRFQNKKKTGKRNK